MTPQDGIQELIDIIRFDLRPLHYKEAVKIAEEAQMFHAKDSEKQRDRLKLIRATETKEQLDQRVRLTNAATSVALGPVYSYAEQVWRTDGVTKDVDNETVPEQIRGRIGDHLKQYYGDASLHRYCFDAALHYTKLDPNAWTVFEVKYGQGRQGESIIEDFYPVEVMSKEVRGIGRDKTGKPTHLAFEFKRKVYKPDSPNLTRELSDFYFYAPGFSIHFVEIDKELTDGIDYEAMGYEPQTVTGSNRMFLSQSWINTTIELPAIRWGAYPSPDHGRKIAETLVATAIPVLDMLLKDNSLLQLTKYVHVFPEKHQYVRRCQHRDEEGLDCISGYYGGYRDEEHKCRQCNGTGKLMVAGEQDTVTIAYPDRAEDLFDLSKLTHYVERPIEILEQYRDIVREASANILKAVYNQQTVDAGDLSQPKTATENRIEFDKIYDKLSPFAELIALAWEKGQRLSYQYYGYTDVKANMTYPFDMKMKSIMDLLIEYNAAKEAGAAYEVMSSITADILNKQHQNNPTKAADIMAFERWKPWKDKTPEEVALILQSRDKADPDRVLWENWTRAMDEVKLGLSVPFSTLPAEAQRQALYDAANVIGQEVVYTQMPDPFTPPVMIGEEIEEPAMIE